MIHSLLFPLVDLGGVVYPVRTLLDVSDNVEDKESCFEFQMKSYKVGTRRRHSYAKVASVDWCCNCPTME